MSRESIQRFHDAWGQFQISHRNLKEATNVLERLESELQVNETNLEVMSDGVNKGESQEMPILTSALEAALADGNVGKSLGIWDCTTLLNVLSVARTRAEKGTLSLLSVSSAKGDVHQMRRKVTSALAKTP